MPQKGGSIQGLGRLHPAREHGAIEVSNAKRLKAIEERKVRLRISGGVDDGRA